MPGFWAMKGYVVKAVENKIVAYQDEGGSKWTLSLPKAVCAAPHSTTDGKVVVAYEGRRKDSCSQLALIDLNKGVKLWDHHAPEAGSLGSGYTSVGMAQSGDLVGMAWFGGSAVIKVSDGKEVSSEKPSAGCSIDGYAGGKVLLRAYSCTNGTARLQQLTPSGSIKWTYNVRKGYKVNNIFSSSPAVVALTDQNRQSGGILAISDKGKERSTLALGKHSYQPECGTDLFGTNMGNCEGVAVSADTFYLPTEMTQDQGTGSTSEIHAFDLDTGNRKWAVKVAERLLLPLNMDGKTLIAYEKPSYSEPGQIVRIAPDGGKPKTLLRLPQATQSTERNFYSATHTYRNGNFYIATNRVTGNDTTPEKLLLAFGRLSGGRAGELTAGADTDRCPPPRPRFSGQIEFAVPRAQDEGTPFGLRVAQHGLGVGGIPHGHCPIRQVGDLHPVLGGAARCAQPLDIGDVEGVQLFLLFGVGHRWRIPSGTAETSPPGAWLTVSSTVCAAAIEHRQSMRRARPTGPLDVRRMCRHIEPGLAITPKSDPSGSVDSDSTSMDGSPMIRPTWTASSGDTRWTPPGPRSP